MKNKKIAVALTALLSLTTLNATTGVFDFETVQSDTEVVGSYTGGHSTWYSGGGKSTAVSTLGHTGTLTTGYFHGGVISNSDSSYFENYTQDCNTVAGGGASGSSQYGVIMPFDMMSTQPAVQDFTINGKVYANASSTPISSSEAIAFLLGESLTLTSIDLSLTAYAYSSLTVGDGYVGQKPLSNDGTFFAVRMYGIDSEGEVIKDNFVDIIMAENIDGVITEHKDWTTVSLANLNGGEAVNGLAFQIISNLGNNYGLTVPGYIALDNVAYTSSVPEPAEWAAIFGVLALGFVIIKRRNRK